MKTVLLKTAILAGIMAMITAVHAEQEEAFLGVTTRKVDKTVRSQLDIPKGIGLIVSKVIQEGPSVGKLQEDDILTKVGEQLLINSDQLGVLVRSRKPGDTIKVEYIRKGKKSTQDITLSKRPKNLAKQFEVPTNIQILGPTIKSFSLDDEAMFPNGALDPKAINGLIAKELSKLDADELNMTPEQISNMIKGIDINVESLMGNSGSGNHTFSSAISSSVISSSMVDEESGCTLNYTATGDQTKLIITDKDGKEVFNGPVKTDEEKAKIPEKYRDAFNQLFKIQDQPWGE